MDGAATYRVQLHPGFGFEDVAAVVGQLADLGITHLYCSPYLQAAPGSRHGYDVADPRRLNDELGGAEGHATLTAALAEHGLGQVLDVVPNHMVTDATNPWWWDVLANGPASRFARYFDIEWEGPDGEGDRVLVPVLGDHYGRVLEAGQFAIRRDAGRFVVRYFDHRFPVAPRSLDRLLAAASDRAGSPPLAEIASGLGALARPRLGDRAVAIERHDRIDALFARLAELCRTDPDVSAAIDDELDVVNADVDRLDGILARQNYRLARWRIASDELDYRRFFNIDSLIGVRVEDEDVFAATHELVFRLVGDGVVDGLRIDHVDGLRDPAGYLDRLAAATGGAFVVVEKILEGDERLPTTWPVAGTSGYDFLIRANDLFVDSTNEAAMTECYASFTGTTDDYDEIVRAAKHEIMAHELVAEVERATDLLAASCAAHRRQSDHTRRELRDAVREVVAGFPVYRTYVTPVRLTTEVDRRHIDQALDTALGRRPDLDRELVHFIGSCAAGEHGGAATEFAARLQQLTAPVMAKGIEDTAFYRYHRLISLNEVGGDPSRFGRPVGDFHRLTADTAATHPAAMLTLSTHDTKRSADVRARLNVLSEVPDAWRRSVERLAELATPHRSIDDLNTEYLLYQTLIGAWPLPVERVVAFMAKATKEAKLHTSWIDPDVEYDEAVAAFTRAVLADERCRDEVERFLRDEHIVERGRRNSLAQTALLLTCPGVPDLYQGNELWDLSLVDPDNRRPVDFELRRRIAAETAVADAGEVLARGDRGDPKLWMTRRLLQLRRRQPHSFVGSAYEPLEASGGRADDLVAFARPDLVVVAPRRGDETWTGTTLDLPTGAWVDVFTGRNVDGGHVDIGTVFAGFPVTVLTREAS